MKSQDSHNMLPISSSDYFLKSQYRAYRESLVSDIMRSLGVPLTLIGPTMMLRTYHYQIGDKVHYVPDHANGNIHHKDVEEGVITNITADYIFVKFSHQAADSNGLSCNPRNIVRLENEEQA